MKVPIELDLTNMTVADAQRLLRANGRNLVVATLSSTRNGSSPDEPDDLWSPSAGVKKRGRGRPKGTPERKKRGHVDMEQLADLKKLPSFSVSGAAKIIGVVPSAIRNALVRLKKTQPQKRKRKVSKETLAIWRGNAANARKAKAKKERVVKRPRAAKPRMTLEERIAQTTSAATE